MSADRRAVEREVKLAIDDSFSVERIADLAVWSTDDRSLDAVYFDTDDLRLLSLGHTLRHRAGDGGAVGTWTLKLAGGAGEAEGDAAGRDEITLDGPLGPPPRPLLRLVDAVVGDAEVAEVARLHTERRRHFAVHDRTDVEIAVDVVTGTSARRPDRAVSFRQLEIELVDGDPAVLPRLEALACRAGAEQASQEPKVATVLGARVSRAHLAAVTLGRRSSVDELVRGSVTAGLRQLLTHEPHLRLDAPADSVHKARVATRRLRSDLQTLAPLLDAAAVEEAVAELRWLAGEIGAVRDLDVLGEHLTAWLATIQDAPDDDDAGLAAVIASRLRNERRLAALVMRNALASRRYRALIDRLRAWSVAPPMGPHARRRHRARKPALGLVRHAEARVRRAVRRLGDPPATDDLHEVRKRAKRCRYAAELVSALVDDDLDDLAEAMAGLQDVLGGLQDAALAQRWLGRLPVERLDRRQAVELGRLRRIAGQAALDARIRWPEQWEAARRERLRRD